jgi:hypothetical protein
LIIELTSQRAFGEKIVPRYRAAPGWLDLCDAVSQYFVVIRKITFGRVV